MPTTATQPLIPRAVLWLIIINGLLFVAQQSFGRPLQLWFALWPLGAEQLYATSQGLARLPGFEPWQLLSYGFLHGSLAHLLFNMFALLLFGREVENHWGLLRFCWYYFFCVIGAALVQLLVASIALNYFGELKPTVGASGGVFGILLAFAMLYPNRYVVLLLVPVPMKAKYFVVLYGLVELYMGISNTQAGVAHFAHLGGMLFGLLLIFYWRKQGIIEPAPQADEPQETEAPSNKEQGNEKQKHEEQGNRAQESGELENSTEENSPGDNQAKITGEEDNQKNKTGER